MNSVSFSKGFSFVSLDIDTKKIIDKIKNKMRKPNIEMKWINFLYSLIKLRVIFDNSAIFEKNLESHFFPLT